jgi:heat shock protein 4
VFHKGFSESDVLNARSREEEFTARDKLVKATEEAKNNLEAFVYKVRDELDLSLRDFCTEAEREDVQERLTETENWLYEDGYYEEDKAVFDKRLGDLKAKTDVFAYRKAENEARPVAAQALRDEIAANLAVANSADEAYAHIDESERATVVKECEAAERWVKEQLAKQAERNLYQDPVFKSQDIDAKTADLRKVCRPIVTKKKPAPKKEEKKEEKASDENKKEETAAENEEGGSDDDAKEGKSSAQEADMDVD